MPERTASRGEPGAPADPEVSSEVRVHGVHGHRDQVSRRMRHVAPYE
jgi:hypothetical protein